MRHYCFLFVFLAIRSFSQPQIKTVKLPNGWQLTPTGQSMPLGDLPLNMEVSPSSKYIAVTNNGHGKQTIELIDVRKQKKIDSVVIARSWYGLKFSADEKYLYASGGHNNRILKYELVNEKLVLIDSIVLGKPWPERIGPAGITIYEK
jgi:DNA-binding beta-propeller fold protein YncE